MTKSAYDTKYGKIETEHGNFYNNEPVFILRGRDALAIQLLSVYSQMCVGNHCNDIHVKLVTLAYLKFENWMLKNPELMKLPSSDEYVKRVMVNKTPADLNEVKTKAGHIGCNDASGKQPSDAELLSTVRGIVCR